MNKILLFGGTTEGRLAAKMIEDAHIPFEICVASDYGRDLLPPEMHARTHVGRLDAPAMKALMTGGQFTHVIDATHPYAAEASENIRTACSGAGLPYLRLLREGDAAALPDGALTAPDAAAAAGMLDALSGPVFLTTGIKEVPAFLARPDLKDRLFVRVLPDAEAVGALKEAGLSPSHIICMQGPFDTDMNLATLRHIQKTWQHLQPGRAGEVITLVTKQSGQAGGFREKCDAAVQAGAGLLVISRPSEDAGGMTPSQLKDCLLQLSGTEESIRDVWLIGMGMSPEHLTGEAVEVLKRCDLVVGARRMIEMTDRFGKDSYCSYNYPEIVDFLTAHPSYRRIAAVFSGDPGFYSGAAALRRCLEGLPFNVHTISGIASPVHFLNTIGKPWEGVHLASLHGRTAAVAALVRCHEKVLFLLGKASDVPDICRCLTDSGLADVDLTIGADLMQDQEIICSGKPEDFTGRTFSPLSMIYIENPKAAQAVTGSALSDEVFIRGNVPMTKAPVRAQVLSALELTPRAVLYDIGAGTGSVAIAAARLIPEGRVYALEKNPEALALIHQNRQKLQADNIIVVEADVPDVPALEQIPTHAFIGGSGGRLEAVVAWLKGLNPKCRIVLTAVTLETISRLMSCCAALHLAEPEILQIQASRAKKAGASHLMKAENPVWVVTIR